MARALFMSCSQRKRSGHAPLPALERYDGPAFRVLRRFLGDGHQEPPVIRIISAEFGLIEPNSEIGPYDRAMTTCRARELRDGVSASFDDCYRATNFDNLMLWASEPYVATLGESLARLPNNVTVHVPTGRIGGRVSQLRDWLYGDVPMATAQASGVAELRGVRVEASTEDVLRVARHHLRAGHSTCGRFETWCVNINGEHVAPKWLVALLTGLPVSRFRTADALNVLRRLGVEVMRVKPTSRDLSGRGKD